MFLALAGVAQATTTPANPPQACNASVVLQAAASKATEARAYWLDRHLLQWPGVVKEGRFRLYVSLQGQLQAQVGGRVRGADEFLELHAASSPVPGELANRFAFVGAGAVLSLSGRDVARVPGLLPGQWMLVREDAAGKVLEATGLQWPGLLDDLYASAEAEQALGVVPRADRTTFKLWAPTARAVSVCVQAGDAGGEGSIQPMQREPATGIWRAQVPRNLSGGYYTYQVDVFVPGVGRVLNSVTDPYSVSLDADSKRSYIADLASPALKPEGWEAATAPRKVVAQTDMVIYELHVRDFSIGDATVSASNRGKYAAFAEADSAGMRHLKALAQAGLTDVHLLPVFDLASVPETGCVTPQVPDAAPDSDVQQAAVMAVAARDCFNWGYDPYHFNAPEGSYASDAADGAKRIVEFRRMVMALHQAGLRVGMDVVYNHTSASGQNATSVLDRIVPGYYQRLDANGQVERSTCCDNTATEHRMMGKLMVDSAVLWATQYRIDSFRFDLMGHQPRAVMETLQARVDRAAGRRINLIGEGWNFGEVADGKRFVQASQLSLNGSGIGTFSDRARDALRGGGPSDSGPALVQRQGWLNGLVYDRNAEAPERPVTELMAAADQVRVGLAGSLRDYRLLDFQGQARALAQLDYSGQPAGYASQPGEVVNYVENHDNQTLYDNNILKLPRTTSTADRARVQVLGIAVTALSQGIAYFHAGIEALRSKSMDRNSFDSGDWFNRLDWTWQDNHFGTGLPPKADNGGNYALLRPLLADARLKPSAADIAFTRDAFSDWLRVRDSSTLFRLRDAADIERRLVFRNVGPDQVPTVIAAHLDGADYPGANFTEVLYLVNADTRPQRLMLAEERGKAYRLHPVLARADAADARARQARYSSADGAFIVPARTAVVFVIK